MAVIGISYDEGNKIDLGYKSVEILYNDLKDKKTFSTGNFIKDWYDMRKFIIQFLLDSEPFFSYSSSVDYFIIDGAPYDSIYLKTDDNGNPYLTNICDHNDDDIEFFVPEGTRPSFEELKEMCK